MIATICSPLVGSQKEQMTKKKELKKPVMKALTFDNQYILIWLLALLPAKCVIWAKLFNSSAPYIPNLQKFLWSVLW